MNQLVKLLDLVKLAERLPQSSTGHNCNGVSGLPSKFPMYIDSLLAYEDTGPRFTEAS